MSEKYMFKAVKFGGFDKTEVYDFIEKTIAENETNEKELKNQIESLQKDITVLKAQIYAVQRRNAELEAVGGSSIPSATSKEIASMKEKTQILCETMLKETNERCQNMLKNAQSMASKTVRLRKDTPINLTDTEIHYEKLLHGYSVLCEAMDIFSDKITQMKEDANKAKDNLVSLQEPSHDE